ncbi:MAG: hypothetical protein JWM56_1264 [Candidatus Peribacteria bacterium]|nr:hypothetical protein [Candidatus Peribacteria bacterium]
MRHSIAATGMAFLLISTFAAPAYAENTTAAASSSSVSSSETVITGTIKPTPLKTKLPNAREKRLIVQTQMKIKRQVKQDGKQQKTEATQVRTETKVQVGACGQVAVDTREVALIAGLASYTTALTGTYQARKTALHDAWALFGTDRKQAVTAAWDAFKATNGVAAKAWKTAHAAAWDTFKAALKTCAGDATLNDAAASEDAGLGAE